uniref:Uncharacterized protein n=1 Tax=Podarcis muralis TaxID=64176 RepID=A0A670IZY3_PODMU
LIPHHHFLNMAQEEGAKPLRLLHPLDNRKVHTPAPVCSTLIFPSFLAVSTDKLAKKKRLIPKIIVTGPSEEVLLNSYTDEIPETKTIRDTEDFGAYSVHTKPSTVDAYRTSRDQ